MCGLWSKLHHQPEPQFLRYLIYKIQNSHYACLTALLANKKCIVEKRSVSLRHCTHKLGCDRTQTVGEVKSRGEWGNWAVAVVEDCLSSSCAGSSSYLTLTKQNRVPRGPWSHPSVLRALISVSVQWKQCTCPSSSYGPEIIATKLHTS